MTANQPVSFDFSDEGDLHDMLATLPGTETVRTSIKACLDAGASVVVNVPGMPSRALVSRESLKHIYDDEGSDLVLIQIF